MEENQLKTIDFDATEIYQYVAIILKRKWVFLACFLLPIIAVTAYSLVSKSIYRSSEIIEVSTGFNMPLNEVYQESRRTFLENQKALMEGDKIESRVLKSLVEWREKIPRKYLEPDVTIQSISGTTMIEVWVDSPYPDYALAYAEAFTREFLAIKKEKRADNSEYALVSLTKESENLNTKLGLAKEKLQKFREENEDVLLEEYGNYSPRHLTSLATRISELETERVLIEKQIKALEDSDNPSFWISVIDNVQKGVVMPAIRQEQSDRPQDKDKSQGAREKESEQMDSGVKPLPFVFVLEKGQSRKWEDLKREYNSLKSESSRISSIYKPKHPVRIDIEEKLAIVIREMKSEISSLLETFKARKENLKLEEEALRNSMAKTKTATLSVSSKMNQLETLKSEVDRLQMLYDVLLKRMSEIEVSTDFGLESVYIVEAPRILSDPVGPKRVRNIILGIMFGLGFGAAAVFLLEYLDDSIKSEEDLKKYTKIPALGVVHSIEWDQKKLSSHKVTLLEDRGAIEEYRSIRTNILLSSPEVSLKSILVTSAVPSEGKTTVSVNVANILAQSGQKVLLIDADLRRPTIHKMFDEKNDKGFSSILLGRDSFEDCVRTADNIGVDFITAGPIVPDPSKLLHSSDMKSFISKVSSVYDKVIIDSAPVLTVTDSVVIGDLVDGIIMVTHGGHTSRVAVVKARETLLDNSSKIIGGIVNNLAQQQKGHYYYQYRYNYNYKYGHPKKPFKNKSKKNNKDKTETIIV